MNKGCRLLLFCQVMLSASLLIGQNISSSIVGNVQDQSGAAIQNAQITVTNIGTGAVMHGKTDSAGVYSIAGLLAGTYDVTAEKAGFEMYRTTGVHLFSSETKRVDAKLRVGAVSQTVVVLDERPQLTTDSMSLGTTITSQQLANLPAAQQTVDSFIALAPGVQARGDATNPEIGGGSHWGSVNFTLNGVEVNDPGNSGAVTVQGVGLLVLPPPSSIQELDVQSNGMDAKYTGHSAVTMVTKAGTNQFHFLLYEYLQNTVLNANTYVLNAAGQPRAPTHLNQFGGNLGGPLWRNKAFFFFDYSGFRHSFSRPVQLTLPSVAMQQGNFSALPVQLYNPFTGQPFSNNQIPASLIAPQSQLLLKYLPAPTTLGSTGLPFASPNYIAPIPITQNVNSFDARVDYNISSSDRIFGVYAQRLAVPWNAFTNYPANYGQGRYGYKNYTASASETHTFSANTLNDFRGAWGDYATLFSGQNQDVNPQTLFPQMPASLYRGLPTMTITGYTGMFHDYGTGYYTPRWNVELTDTFTHIHGGHTFEAGIDETGYKISSRVPSTGSATSAFSFNGKWTGNLGWPGAPTSAGNAFADFLLGTASTSSTAPVGAFAAPIYSRDWGAYVQDTWQAMRNLTLIYGLRYEYQSPWMYRTQQVTTFDMAHDKLVIPENSATPTLPANADAALFAAYPLETTQSIGLPLNYIQPDRRNFAPRVGFAYRPLAHTVVRGGFGIYYNFQPGFVGSRADGWNPPWKLSINQSFSSKLPGKPTKPYLPDLTFANPFPSTSGTSVITPNPTINMLQWDFKNAATNEWNLTVEQAFGKSWSIRTSYVGHLAEHLPWNSGPINVPAIQTPNVPIQNQRPFQPFGAINATRSGGYQTYNQLEAGINKRFTQGFSFQAEYQYTRSLDDVATSGGPQLWRQPYLDYGNTDGTRRHWLVFNYIYQLPFGRGRHWLNQAHGAAEAVLGGWQISGITTYGSGAPFSVSYSQTGTKFIGWWPGRADRVPGASLYAGRQSGSHDILDGVPWYNVNAFAAPQPWAWGNSARNLLFGPGFYNWDMSGMKSFGLPEKLSLDFRADLFDAFNHFNLGQPDATIADTRDNGTPIPTSGRITGGDGSRVVQLSLSLRY